MDEPISTPAATEPQTTTTDPTPAAEPQPTQQPQNLLDGDDQQPGSASEPAKAEPAKGPASLLDDDTPAGQEPAAQDGQPTEEAVKAWTDGIKAVDLGDGVKWDDDALKAMTPELMRLSSGDPKNAEGLVKAYTEYQRAQAKQIAEYQDQFNNGLIKQCEAKFGSDLKKIAGYAKRGGLEVFGDKLWGEIRKVPQFANNPDIMERLAAIGRKLTNDGGRVNPKDGDPAPEHGDVLHRMYGGVKV